MATKNENSNKELMKQKQKIICRINKLKAYKEDKHARQNLNKRECIN